PFELHRVCDFRSEGLHPGADVPAHDATFSTQALHYLTRQICWNSKADSLVSAAAGEDRGIDAEQPALDVNERATRVAHVNSCVGLNKILVINNSHAATANRADDPHCDRLPKPKGIANRQHNVACSRFVAVSKVDGRQIVLVDF